jgi:methionyl-tRNA formyltransferase
MKLLFAGTPAIAVPSLEALAQHHEVCAVLTAPDALAGRGRQPQVSAVKAAALNLGLAVLQPEKLDQIARDQLLALQPDLLVCVAYGKIFGPRFLALFPLGGINVHPSLLPAYRGPSPITQAILDGCSQTGITVQKLALAMDSGDILVQEPISLTGQETTATLTHICALGGARLVVRVVAAMERGAIESRPQSAAAASYCHLIHKTDGLIKWDQPAIQIERQVRAYDPWPRAMTIYKRDPLYVLTATVSTLPTNTTALPGTVVGIDKQQGILVQTGQGILAIQRLQSPTRKAVDHIAFFNGAQDLPGSRLGEHFEAIA